MDVDLIGDGVPSEWQSVISSTNFLLVDSKEASLVHTASLLQEKVYSVTTAGTAARALELLKVHNGFYHIVMTDCYLQDMDIFEFIERIQDQCLTPIILMTEDYNIDLAEDALTKGASFFIQKPLAPSHLASLLYQIMWITRTVPVTISRKQKRNSDEGNIGKGKKSLNAEGPSDFQENREWRSLPSITPASTNYAGYTIEFVQQKLKELHSINTVGGSSQVAGQNGGFQTFIEGGQVTSADGNVMRNTESDQLAEEIARVQAQITDDDIDELLRMINDEEVTNPVEENSTIGLV